MQPQRLTTQRLILNPLTPTHAADLFPAFSDPETMRFMPSQPHTTVDDSQTEIQNMLGPEDACYWAICLAGEGEDVETEKAIGFVGYLGNPGVPGMGYFLQRDYWQQGITTEAVAAALDYGFEQLGLDRVELWINHDNIGSQKLAEKVGFSRRGQFRMRYPREADGHDKLVYGIYRQEWQARPARIPASPRSLYRIEPVLAVADVATTASYYRDMLDFDVDFLYGDPPEHGGVSCCEWTPEGGRIQLSKEDVDMTHKEMALYLFVGPDLDERYARYKERGVTIHRELDTFPWGMREFAIRDCNGYILRFGTAG